MQQRKPFISKKKKNQYLEHFFSLGKYSVNVNWANKQVRNTFLAYMFMEDVKHSLLILKVLGKNTKSHTSQVCVFR